MNEKKIEFILRKTSFQGGQPVPPPPQTLKTKSSVIMITQKSQKK